MNNIENSKNNDAPSLKDFGLDFSVYADFKKQYGEIIKSTENNIFINAVIVFVWIVVYASMYYLLFNFFKIPKNGWAIFIFTYLLFFASIWMVIDEWKIKNLVSNFIRNLFTNGKYLIAIEERIKAQNRVRAFEEAYCAYFQKKIDYFFEENINRKRRRLDESLEEFCTMLNSALKINEIFLTKQLYVESDIQYLKKRLGHSFSPQDYFKNKAKRDSNLEKINKDQVNDTNQQEEAHLDESGDMDEFIFPENKHEDILISPEERHRIPRKIDWENVNKNKQITGLRGEEIVVELERKYLQVIGKSELAEKVRHVAKDDGDGMGYDVLSFFPNGREKYIEVKSTKNSVDGQYYISRNELSFLQENQESSFIYRIKISDENEVLLVVKTAHEILNNADIVPVQFIVKAKQ